MSEVNTDDIDSQVTSTSSVSSFLTGLVVPFSNSAVIFFYVSLLPTFIDVNRLGWVDGFTAILVISVALFIVLVAYSYGAARARGLLRDRRARQQCNQGAGVLIVGTGVYIAVRQT